VPRDRARPLVLVADDDADIVALVRLGLERAGMDVAAAADGRAALLLAQAAPPDAAVLDVMMPRVDGLEVTRQLRARPPPRRSPILILSAAVQDAHVALARTAGADEHLAKPFSPKLLAARVVALLAQPARR
jgi:two-component system alkaline phosphatase synthesis response regulator PhoP